MMDLFAKVTIAHSTPLDSFCSAYRSLYLLLELLFINYQLDFIGGSALDGGS